MVIYVKYDIIYGYGTEVDIDADNNQIIVRNGEEETTFEYGSSIGNVYEVNSITDFELGKYKYVDGEVIINPEYQEG
jgi:hypothetical protein